MRLQRIRQKWRNGERGAALVEFAIAIPIFLFLISLIFDTGLGFAASRSSSATARSAARVGALAGERSDGDQQILEAIRATYGGSDVVRSITVYKSTPGGTGDVPEPCRLSISNPVPTSTADTCNVYPGTILDNLASQDFSRVVDANGDPTACQPSALDFQWCPIDRRPDDLSNIVHLGVSIWVDHEPTAGLATRDTFELQDRAVFAMYFPPEPLATPGP